MKRQRRRARRPPAGARPGTLVVSEASGPSRATLHLYDEGGVEERPLKSPADLTRAMTGGKSLWLDVTGLSDADFLREIGRILEIHPLALEDVVHVPQRPKAEEYVSRLLMIAQAFRPDGSGATDQLSLIIGERFLVSFHEREAAVMKPVLERLRDGKGPMRRSGAAYLAYAILDSVVDGYFPVAEELGERSHGLESKILSAPRPEHLEELNGLKAAVLSLRRIAWAQRDAVNRMMRDMEDHVDRRIRVYLRDVHDHCSQIVESCDAQREVVNGLMNMYLSVVSNRMNEVMKVLTIMASIFIPLTFLAGIYGMNFSHMPELDVAWAYPVLLGTMGALAVGMVFYFRRKGWIGRSGGADEDENKTG